MRSRDPVLWDLSGAPFCRPHSPVGDTARRLEFLSGGAGLRNGRYRALLTTPDQTLGRVDLVDELAHLCGCIVDISDGEAHLLSERGVGRRPAVGHL